MIVSVVGELDLATVPPLRETAVQALHDPECSTLVLDLDGLTFLDSTGLGCWIELRNLAEDAGKQLELVSVPPSARRTVSIAGLATVFGLES